jgi:hypothetical protein
MKWVAINEGVPKHGKSALVENRSGQYYKMEFSGMVGTDWYERNLIRWLDEESNDPVFSLEDMKHSWIKSHQVTYENTSYDKIGDCLEADYSYIEKERDEWFNKKYNVEL